MTDHPLSILVSAYACEPGRGSEPGVGWNFIKALSGRHKITVLTRANNRPVILNSGEDWVESIDWVWVDPPRWLTFWKHGPRGVQLFYILWQLSAYRSTKKLISDGITFDLIHHVTLGKYWIPSLLSLFNIPFIFGPVGGGDLSPPGFSQYYPLSGKLEEFARILIHNSLPFMPFSVHLYESNTLCFAATEQTKQRLKALGVKDTRLMPQSALSEQEFIELSRHRKADSYYEKLPKRLNVITACRLVHWKAVDLAVEAVMRVNNEGYETSLTILNDGPEMEHLTNMVRELGASLHIKFAGKLPSLDHVHQSIASSDVMIHPALHEAFGQSCLEAIAMGVPVICMDWAGPSMIVDKSCGWRIKPVSREQSIEGIVTALKEAHQENSNQRRKRSVAAIERAKSNFSWQQTTDEISAIYDSIISNK